MDQGASFGTVGKYSPVIGRTYVRLKEMAKIDTFDPYYLGFLHSDWPKKFFVSKWDQDEHFWKESFSRRENFFFEQHPTIFSCLNKILVQNISTLLSPQLPK